MKAALDISSLPRETRHPCLQRHLNPHPEPLTAHKRRIIAIVVNASFGSNSYINLFVEITQNHSTNNQLDATIQFISDFNQLNMFRAIISPILRSTTLCLQLVVKCTEEVAFW